jgi:hypothetical protein
MSATSSRLHKTKMHHTNLGVLVFLFINNNLHKIVQHVYVT